MNYVSEYERIVWLHNSLVVDNFNVDDYYHEFGKSERTLQRDVVKLRDYFGAPVVRNNKGYAYNEKTFNLPQMIISQKELSALYTAFGFLEKFKNTPIYDATKKLVKKLSSNQKQSKFEGFRISQLKKKEIELDWEVFNKIAKSIINKYSIFLDYHSFNSDTKTLRMVDPYHLYTYDEEMYLAGFCHNNNAIRDFNLNRVQSVRETETNFESDFSKEEYFADKNWGIIKDQKVEKILLRIKLDVVDRIIEDFPSRFKKIRIQGEWGIFEIETTVTEEFIKWLISMGKEIVVIEPKSLKDRIKKELNKILKNYER